jgi:hypothetical protein
MCLLYADDALFLLKGEEQQLMIFKVLLNAYHRLSGLRDSIQKSELIITGASDNQAQSLAEIL